jgi:hypothetical protein
LHWEEAEAEATERRRQQQEEEHQRKPDFKRSASSSSVSSSSWVVLPSAEWSYLVDFMMLMHKFSLGAVGQLRILRAQHLDSKENYFRLRQALEKAQGNKPLSNAEFIAWVCPAIGRDSYFLVRALYEITEVLRGKYRHFASCGPWRWMSLFGSSAFQARILDFMQHIHFWSRIQLLRIHRDRKALRSADKQWALLRRQTELLPNYSPILDLKATEGVDWNPSVRPAPLPRRHPVSFQVQSWISDVFFHAEQDSQGVVQARVGLCAQTLLADLARRTGRTKDAMRELIFHNPKVNDALWYTRILFVEVLLLQFCKEQQNSREACTEIVRNATQANHDIAHARLLLQLYKFKP